MTEKECLAAIAHEVNSAGRVTPHALELVETGLRDCPTSTALWNRRGDLIQTGDDDTKYTLGDALASYRHALALDPKNEEAEREIANFLELHAELNGRAG